MTDYGKGGWNGQQENWQQFPAQPPSYPTVAPGAMESQRFGAIPMPGPQQGYPQQQQPQPGFQPGQQQQGFQPGQLPGFLNVPGLNSDVAAKIGLEYGSQALQASQSYLASNVNRYISIPQLKYYFDVSNEYVGKKLALILFPFRHKVWTRELAHHDPSNGTTTFSAFRSPRDDVNAPDMYIPIMAFITYVLLVGYAFGTRRQFSPELLGIQLSTGIGVLIFEVLMIRLGSYLLNLTSEFTMFDLISYAGYKYVSIIVTTIFTLLFGSTGKMAAFVYTSIALFIFVTRAMRGLVMGNVDSSGTVPAGRRRQYFLLMIGLSQVVTSFFMLIGI